MTELHVGKQINERKEREKEGSRINDLGVKHYQQQREIFSSYRWQYLLPSLTELNTPRIYKVLG
jgi:hypothetical protein